MGSIHVNVVNQTVLTRDMSLNDFSKFGSGHVAYVKETTYAVAQRLFPGMEGIPKGVKLFALIAADGEPLQLTDSREAAIELGREDELAVQKLQ